MCVIIQYSNAVNRDHRGLPQNIPYKQGLYLLCEIFRRQHWLGIACLKIFQIYCI